MTPKKSRRCTHASRMVSRKLSTSLWLRRLDEGECKHGFARSSAYANHGHLSYEVARARLREQVLNDEARVQSLLTESIQHELAEDERHKDSHGEMRAKILKRQLEKAGYEYDHRRLDRLNSLMSGLTPFLNSEVWNVSQRRMVRRKMSEDDILPRIVGRFETNLYFAERVRRFADQNKGARLSGGPGSFGKAVGGACTIHTSANRLVSSPALGADGSPRPGIPPPDPPRQPCLKPGSSKEGSVTRQSSHSHAHAATRPSSLSVSGLSQLSLDFYGNHHIEEMLQEEEDGFSARLQPETRPNRTSSVAFNSAGGEHRASTAAKWAPPYMPCCPRKLQRGLTTGVSAAQQATDSLMDATKTTPRKGFSFGFIELVVGMSFFSSGKLANLAANDFLRHPMLMMACYLEWSAAARELAKSGQLDSAASSGVEELSVWLARAPAACLDYFDSMYIKVDADGEYAGFTISGHLLRNESIFDRTDPEYAHLPLMLTQPLAVIQVAIKHEIKPFLSQPKVHSFLRAEWYGGGISELIQGEAEDLNRVITTWVCFWWLIIPYNIILMIAVAIFPPLQPWYISRYKFQQMQTHERVQWGLCFIPVCKYATSAFTDAAAAVAFTWFSMMPFTDQFQNTHNGYTTPTYDIQESANYLHVWRGIVWMFIRFYSVSAFIEEVGLLYSALYAGLELRKEWLDVFILLAQSLGFALNKGAQVAEEALSNAATKAGGHMRAPSLHRVTEVSSRRSLWKPGANLASAFRMTRSTDGVGGLEPSTPNTPNTPKTPVKARLADIASFLPRSSGSGGEANSRGVTAVKWTSVDGSPTCEQETVSAYSPPSSPPPSPPMSELSKSLRRRRHGRRRVRTSTLLYKQTCRAVYTTFRGLFSFSRLVHYLHNNFLDVLTRTLCVVSVTLASQYSLEDFETYHIVLFSKESVLAYTVLLLWIRQIKVLQITVSMGSFVYMLGQMLEDVFRWFIIYAFAAAAFASGLYVLYRNDRPNLGHRLEWVGEDCQKLEAANLPWGEVVMLLLEMTLEGSGYWYCFRQSSAPVPGLLMLSAFLILVVLMLLNTLIAMMADTFSTVTKDSFMNYAFAFSKVLVIERSSGVAMPLNALSLVYESFSFLFLLLGKIRNTSVNHEPYESSQALPVNRGRGTSTDQHSPNKRSAVDKMVHGIAEMGAELVQTAERAHLMPTARDAALDQRDPVVLKKVNDIRLSVLQDSGQKLRFERSIARFCRQQDESEPMSIEDVRNVVHEIVSETGDLLLEAKFQKYFGSTKGKSTEDSTIPPRNPVCAGSMPYKQASSKRNLEPRTRPARSSVDAASDITARALATFGSSSLGFMLPK